MHDLLEGVLQYEVKLLLAQFISEDRYFTLEQLNHRIESFELGYSEARDRPTQIASTTLSYNDNHLKQSGCIYVRVHVYCVYHIARKFCMVKIFTKTHLAKFSQFYTTHTVHQLFRCGSWAICSLLWLVYGCRWVMSTGKPFCFWTLWTFC